MKYIIFLFVFFIHLNNIQAQDNYDVTKAFRNVAEEAFAKLSPATKQWFATTAKQHPAGSFNTTWANEKLKQKFTIEQMNSMGDLFVAMMAYQKMVNKEIREDAKITRENKQSELNAKESKLELENAKIDQVKNEAGEKYEHAMDAATIEMVLGTVSTAAASTSSIQNQAGSNSKTTLVRPTKIDSPRLTNSQVNLKDKNIYKEQTGTKESEAHKKAQKDAIKKLLNQLTELNRRVQL